MPDHRCGSSPGWYAHKRRGEKPCTACDAEYKAVNRADSRIRTAAVRRLIAAHPREYDQLRAEERERDRAAR